MKCTFVLIAATGAAQENVKTSPTSPAVSVGATAQTATTQAGDSVLAVVWWRQAEIDKKTP